MSHRPIMKKRLRRLRRNITRKPLPAYIDIVEWLKDRGHASSTKEAAAILLAERVKSESHTVGIRPQNIQVGNTYGVVNIVDRYVPASMRSTLYVKSA